MKTTLLPQTIVSREFDYNTYRILRLSTYGAIIVRQGDNLRVRTVAFFDKSKHRVSSPFNGTARNSTVSNSTCSITELKDTSFSLHSSCDLVSNSSFVLMSRAIIFLYYCRDTIMHSACTSKFRNRYGYWAPENE